MLGMIQILTYLLCVYLVFKGVEILQIALCSTKEDKRGAVMLGVVMLIAGIIAAVGFFFWSTAVAYNVSVPMQGL